MNILSREYLERVNTIAIYGDIGTGKTALAYKILEAFKDRPVYFLKHPFPDSIEKLGYVNLPSLEEVERLQDCVIYWDEPQLTTSIYDHKTNSVIARLCSLARQLGIKLIISSSDTRVFTRHNEAYFDLWLVKDVDYAMVKNGSKIKKAIRSKARIEAEGFRLALDEFISESRKLAEFNGRLHKFSLPTSWGEQLSKPYRAQTEVAKETTKEVAKKQAKGR